MKTGVPGLPKIELSIEDYSKLFATVKWYSQMPPDYDPGDEFNENIDHYRMSFLPELSDEAADEGWYCAFIEINRNGELIAAFDCEDEDVGTEDDPFIYVPFVVKEE